MTTPHDIERMLIESGDPNGETKRYLFVTSKGRVIRDVQITETGKHEGVDAVFGLVDNPFEVGVTSGKVTTHLPLSECLHAQLDPRVQELDHFSIKLYGEAGANQIVMASWDYSEGRAFAYTIAKAIERLRSGRYFNPPDCSCEHVHCSFRTCRSIVPSHGAIKEEGRTYPTDARV